MQWWLMTVIAFISKLEYWQRTEWNERDELRVDVTWLMTIPHFTSLTKDEKYIICLLLYVFSAFIDYL